MGGIIADQDSYGVRSVCIEHILKTKNKREERTKPSLLVCHRTRSKAWLEQMSEYSNQLTVVHLPVKGPDLEPDVIEESDLIVVSHSLLTRRLYILQKINWDTLIVDELERIKSTNNQTIQAMKLLRANTRLSITTEMFESDNFKSLEHHLNVFSLGKMLPRTGVNSGGRLKEPSFVASVVEKISPFIYGSSPLSWIPVNSSLVISPKRH